MKAQEQMHWRLRLLVSLGVFIVGILARTWRFESRNHDGWHRLKAQGQPFVLVLWHGTLLPLSYWHRDQGISVLVSEHRDGEIIARVLHSWGCRTVRGSTTRGGGRALLAMIAELNRGHVVAVTPDGPQGPAHVFQPGALVAANRAGVPVVAIAITVRRAWRLNSWDQFIIPKPFARISVAYGDPVMVNGASPREAATDITRFETVMRDAQERSAHA
jgi:lysophospholipid acyltransferase (LPLAT)-like uncharacterized protein